MCKICSVWNQPLRIFVSVPWWQNDFRETMHLLPPIHLAEVKVFQMFRGLPRAKPHPVLGSGWWLAHGRGHEVKDAALFCRDDLEKVHTPETTQYTCVSSLWPFCLRACLSEWKWTHTEKVWDALINLISSGGPDSDSSLCAIHLTLMGVKQHSETQRERYRGSVRLLQPLRTANKAERGRHAGCCVRGRCSFYSDLQCP